MLKAMRQLVHDETLWPDSVSGEPLTSLAAMIDLLIGVGLTG